MKEPQKLLKLKSNMGSVKIFHALYNDDDILLSAVKKIKEKHYDIEEVYTPFPVHGLDKAMGLEPTRIAIAAFIYGCIGITCLLYTSPSPRDTEVSRMPSSA